MSFISRLFQPNISKLEKEESIYELFKIFYYDKNPQTQKKAYNALITVGKKNSHIIPVDICVRFSGKELSEQERISTINLLADIGDHRYIEGISIFLQEDSWRIREASAKALGKFGSDVAVPPLLKALKELRFFSDTAINAMIRSNDDLAKDLITSALAVQEGKVQIAIVEALEQIAPENNQQVIDNLAELRETLSSYKNMKQQRPSLSFFSESLDKMEKELRTTVDKALHTLSNIIKTKASKVDDQTKYISTHKSNATPLLTVESKKEIRNLAQAGKIEAIKRIRELTGFGLKDAEDYLKELVSNQCGPSGVLGDPSSLISSEAKAELQSLLTYGQRIEAIKRVRELTGLGLQEAKDYVDMLGTGEKVNNRITETGQGSRGIIDCYKCRHTIGDGSLSHTASVFQSGVFSSMTYECKSCGKKYCLDCTSVLKKSGGLCEACGGELGW